MKKVALLFAFILLTAIAFSQKNDSIPKQAAKDSITAMDIQKHKYLVSMDIVEYNNQCYRDSIPVTEFYGKQIDGTLWRDKLRHYWDPWTPVPNGVKYLHWRGTWEGFLEFLTIKYR